MKVKAQNLKLNISKTGGGGPLLPLSQIEEKLMGIIGWTVVEGDTTSELGFVSILKTPGLIIDIFADIN